MISRVFRATSFLQKQLINGGKMTYSYPRLGLLSKGNVFMFSEKKEEKENKGQKPLTDK